MGQRGLAGLELLLQTGHRVMYLGGEIVERLALERNLAPRHESADRQTGQADRDRHESTDSRMCDQLGVSGTGAAEGEVHGLLPDRDARCDADEIAEGGGGFSAGSRKRGRTVFQQRPDSSRSYCGYQDPESGVGDRERGSRAVLSQASTGIGSAPASWCSTGQAGG